MINSELTAYSNLWFAESSVQMPSDPNSVFALQELLERVIMPQIGKHVAESVRSTWEPMMENLSRKVMQVKEQLDLITEKLNPGAKQVSENGTHGTGPEPQHLALKFFGKVREPLFTGQYIQGEGEGNSSIQVALVDANGKTIDTGPEASSEVEISVLAEGEDSQKRQPILSRNKLKLDEGIAFLDNIKFRNKSKWTQDCRIKLLARNMKVGRTTVKDAISEPFLVRDHRSTLYNKHYPPLLSDEMLGIGSEKLTVIVNHAKTCKIPENQCYTYNSPCSWERKMTVVFDEVGCIRGLINADHQFVPVDSLPEDEKGDANKLVVSAFQNWKDVRPYDNKPSPFVFPSQAPSNVDPSGNELECASSAGLASSMDDNDDNCFLTSQEIRDLFITFGLSSDMANPRVESPDVINATGGAFCKGFSAQDHVPSSGKAKRRWKLVVMSIRKKIETPAEPEEHTRAQKKQRRG
ncbi:OLC1v1003414C1 [Oldenlandia corymbosa var. corymbosa]|uniref:OLC1v1003414C1 n=1 Tax=Oldenlandia corymbosa var. corymbosa TaxID=529605 RepID=A0AAV1DA59_OLDCO|nr:OLC1v1003414C1 [Oldenlandia corymbosa var. corymbosa]